MATSRKKKVKESSIIIKKLTRKIFGGVGEKAQKALTAVKNSRGAVVARHGTPIKKPRGQPTQDEINAARRRETVRRTYASQNRARVAGPRLAAEKAAAEAAAAIKAKQEAEAAARKAEQNKKDKEAANARAAEEAAKAAATLKAEKNAANRAAALKAEQNAARAAEEAALAAAAANAALAAQKAAEEEAIAKAAKEEAATAADADARRVKDTEERETVRRLAEQRKREKEEQAKQETISTVQEIQPPRNKINQFTEQIRELETMGSSTQPQGAAFGTSAAHANEENYLGIAAPLPSENNIPEVYPDIQSLINELEAMLPTNGKYSNTSNAEREMSLNYLEKKNKLRDFITEQYDKNLITSEQYLDYFRKISNMPSFRRIIPKEKLEEIRKKAEQNKIKSESYIQEIEQASAAAPTAISAQPPIAFASPAKPAPAILRVPAAVAPSLPTVEEKTIEQVIANAEEAASAANIRAAEAEAALIKSLLQTAEEASNNQNLEQAVEASAEQIVSEMKPLLAKLEIAENNFQRVEKTASTESKLTDLVIEEGEAPSAGLGGEEAVKKLMEQVVLEAAAALASIEEGEEHEIEAESAQEGNAVSIEMPPIEEIPEIIEETKRKNADTEQKLEIGDVSKNDVDNIMELHKQLKQIKENFIGKRAELIEIYNNEQDQERKTKLEQQVLQVDDVIDDLDRELSNITRVAYAVVKKYIEQKKKKAEENVAQAPAGEKPAGEKPTDEEATSGEAAQAENQALEALGKAVEAAQQAEEERPKNTSEGEAKKKQSLLEIIKQSILAIAYSKKAKKAKEEQKIEEVKEEIKEKITEVKKQSNFHQAKLMNNLVSIYYKDDNTIDLNKIKLIRDMVNQIVTESSK